MAPRASSLSRTWRIQRRDLRLALRQRFLCRARLGLCLVDMAAQITQRIVAAYHEACSSVI